MAINRTRGATVAASSAASSGRIEAPRGGSRGREALADLLRRRSGTSSVQAEERTAAVQASLNAVTRGVDGGVVDVPLEDLHPNPFQPRFHFQRQPLQELAQSLASEGQLEPIIARRIVREGVEMLEVVAGARRLEAARMCNADIRPFTTLRTDIRVLTDEEAERLSLIENLQRENLTPLEEGYRYWQLQQRDIKKWSVRAIADFVHKKKSTVQNRLGLVKEPAVAEAVLQEQIPPTAGFHIMRLPPGERVSYLGTAVAQQLTVEMIKADIDRRMAPRRSPVVLRLDKARRNGASEETDDNAIFVRGHLRRSRRGEAAEAPAARAAQRETLEDERQAILSRVEELETELRGLNVRLRAIDRELAWLKA
jgi:ParB family transcriptional regulator, chromosome partitioning protein